LRHRDVGSRPKRIDALRRLSAAVSLAVSLVLSLSPFVTAPVAAAPPETTQEATTESSGVPSDSGTESVDPLTVDSPQSPETQNQRDIFVVDIATLGTNGVDTSVRPRGLEAPVQLEQQEAQGADRRQQDGKAPDKQENVERDPGDGPIQKRQDVALERDQTRDGERSDIRIWPMPAESYTFTQQFGCVQQLGNLYFPGEGCPAASPVIHTGIDLAAPEGTPFYAAASGWVTLADYDRPTADANTRIIIQHDGRNERYATDYLHWIASYVEEGDYVHAGDPIGEVGSVGYSTGPHLHFSVTDLDSDEHVDPLRWLPDEPGLEGYVSRTPKARLRLPAGTTAGQPESADPAPPPPPVKEDVPESPPEGGKRGEGSKRRSDKTREERRAARDGSAPTDTKGSGKKRSGNDAVTEKTAEEPTAKEPTAKEPTSDTTKDRDQSRGRTRSRERDKAGSQSESTDTPIDSGGPTTTDSSSNSDRRGNQETSKDASGSGKDASGGGKDKPKSEGSKREARNTEPDVVSGRDKQGGRDERNADRQNPDQTKRDGGGAGGSQDRRQ
jgi:murein DD-endopeptidase MepM/ murein hydrolase activator NlpD